VNRCLACSAAAILLFCVTGFAPQDDTLPREKPVETEKSRLRVKTELVGIQAVVADSKGRVIEDLKEEDFELLENDRPQKIGFFTVSKIESAQTVSPAPAAKTGTEKPVELRQVQDRLREPPVRTTLLFVDNLHLSFSSLNWVKQALHRFINEQMTDQDVVALATSQSLGVAQQYTRDKQLLHYAIEQMRFGALSSTSYFTPNIAAGVLDGRQDAVSLAVDIVRVEEQIECPCSLLLTLARTRAQQILSQTAYSRRSTLAILGDYAQRMVDLPGRRMVVVFSDGFTMRDSRGGISQDALHSTINRAVRSGVVIYSIDAAGVRLPPMVDASRSRPGQGFSDEGLMGCYRECEQGSSPFIDECINEGATGGEALKRCCQRKCMDAFPGSSCAEDRNTGPNPVCFPPGPGILDVYVSEFELEQLNGLHMIAEETGGRMYGNTNNLNDLLGRAFDANRYYYVLSYYPSDDVGPDSFRKIEVRVRNHPEYKVRAPKGFRLRDSKIEFQEEEGQTPQQKLLMAMNRPLPVTDLGLSATADYLETETDDKKVSLTVNFEGDRFQYRQEEQRNVVELEILSVVYDSSGKQVDGISAQVEAKLTPEGMEQAKNKGYRFSRRLALDPGIYKMRVGVREEGSDHIGTASTWVEVPELKPDKLEMSSLILCNPLDTEPTEADHVKVNELEQVKMVQGVPIYETGDIFYYTFRVHAGAEGPGSSDLLWMREVSQGGAPVVEGTWRKIPPETLTFDSEGWFDLDDELDISEYKAGVYELRVSVKDAASGDIVKRTVAFGIE
jgi:VWFA-related protein